MFALSKISKILTQGTKLNQFQSIPTIRKAFSSFNHNNEGSYRGTYTPIMPLKFIDNKCKVYEYTIYNQLSKGYYIILGIGGLLSLYFINKLLNFKERKWYGMIFFSAGAIFLCPKVIQFANIFSCIIHQIHLNKCGTQITVKHAKYGLIPTYSKFDITTIVKPMDPNIAIQMYRFAYPVVMDNQLFYLPRDTDFQNEEVLPPILNGIYINTDQNDNHTDEIIIE